MVGLPVLVTITRSVVQKVANTVAQLSQDSSWAEAFGGIQAGEQVRIPPPVRIIESDTTDGIIRQRYRIITVSLINNELILFG
jgi:hypothetical protein